MEPIRSAISIARSAARRAFASSSPSSTNQRAIDARPISSAPTSNVSLPLGVAGQAQLDLGDRPRRAIPAA